MSGIGIARLSRRKLRANPTISTDQNGSHQRPWFHAHCSVVVVCHNYARYLRECLDSVLLQSHAAVEIVVVDDASTDATREVAEEFAANGVRYLRIDANNVQQARRAGFAATQSPFLMFLDADDRLGPNYLAEACHLLGDPTVGIVYSDLRHFGDASGIQELKARPIERANYIHAGAVVRRVALEGATALDGDPPSGCHADWYLWRRVLADRWRAVKSQGEYFYRVHGDSMQRNRFGAAATYFVRAALQRESVTIALPLSGRPHELPRLWQWLETQTWPEEQTQLLVIDSGDDQFGQVVRQWLAEQRRYTSYRYVKLKDCGRLPDADRRDSAEIRALVRRAMPQLYNRLAAAADTEYVLVLEDDVGPPADAIEKLLRGMDMDVAAVSGAYRSRYEPDRFVAWTNGNKHVRDRGHGLQDIAGTGFGCLLVRRSVLRESPLHHGGATGDYDHSFAELVAERRLRWRVHWEVPCTHGGIAAYPSVPCSSTGDWTGPRHLLYHIYPRPGQTWRWNVRQLLHRWDLFTGRRIIGIATDQSSETFDQVIREFGHVDAEFFERENRSDIGESSTLFEGLDRLRGEAGVVFRGHAKGVTREGTARQEIVRRWAEHLYVESLDDWQTVESALRESLAAGPLLRVGVFPQLPGVNWHFSGSFYWFHLKAALERAWRVEPVHRFLAEAWPAHVFSRSEVVCLGNPGVVSLYQADAWPRLE